MNTIILTGRLTKDPEIKYGQSGKAYSRFSLAVNREFSKDGEADFINCVAFGKTAEVIGEFLRKGRKVGIIGRLQMNRYEANGEKRISYDVLVNQVEFLEPKDDHWQKPEEQKWSEPEAVKQNSVAGNTDGDDEFPF